MNESIVEHRPPEAVDVMKMIRIKFTKGNGTNENPIRLAERYFDLEGNLIFEKDYLFVNSSASEIETSNEM